MPKKKTTEEFIQDAIEVHGDRYDYSKVEYKNSSSKVIIICKEHGEFEQNVGNHIHNKQILLEKVKEYLELDIEDDYIWDNFGYKSEYLFY